MDLKKSLVKSNPITQKQKELMLEFIQSRKEMYTGKFTQTYTKEKMLSYWNELTSILNSVPDGPSKDWKHWRKTWVDLKKNTKCKFVEQKKHAIQTGGGTPLPPMEDDFHQKFLQIITPISISGNMEVEEPAVMFSLENEQCHDQYNEFEPENAVTGVIASGKEMEDHSYVAKPGTSKEIPNQRDHSYVAKPGTSKEIPNESKKRFPKTARLQTALKNNERFLKINEENMESEKNFRQKKIEMKERDFQLRKEYFNKKNETLNDIAKSFREIVDSLRDIKNHLIFQRNHI